MSETKIQLNGFGRLGKSYLSTLTDGMGLFVDDTTDKLRIQEGEMERKKAEYADVNGRRFRPTFESPIDYFEIRGYDAERNVVLTIAHPKDGEPFDDEIEERYFKAAFETGDYKAINEQPLYERDGCVHIITNPYVDFMDFLPKERKQIFNGTCCNRCKHRFGTTSNKEWCRNHFANNKCYKFKLDM